MRTMMMGAAALALAGCISVDHTELAPAAPAMTAAEAREIVEAANARFEAYFAVGDAAAVASLYTKDGRLIPPDAPDQVGPAAIEAYWTGAMTVVASVSLKTAEAVPAGPGLIAERAHATLYAADGSVVGRGKAVLLWALEDGEWKMRWDSWNDGPVAP